MRLIDPNETIPDEVPADPNTQTKLRRTLLYLALGSLVVSCGLCWYSSLLQNIEQILIPGLMGIMVLTYTINNFYQRQQKQDLAPPLGQTVTILGILIGITSLAIIWLLSAIGWQKVSGPIILILGAWSFFLAGRRVWESWSFSREAIEEVNDLVELKMISIDGSHPIYPQLIYRYAENYRGLLQSNRIRRKLPQIRHAIRDGKFQVSVKYLPDNPRIHRLTGWKILP